MNNAPVYYDGLHEPTLGPELEWSINTLTGCSVAHRVQRSSLGYSVAQQGAA